MVDVVYMPAAFIDTAVVAGSAVVAGVNIGIYPVIHTVIVVVVVVIGVVVVTR